MTTREIRNQVRRDKGVTNTPFGSGTHTKIGLAALWFMHKLNGASPRYEHYRHSK